MISPVLEALDFNQTKSALLSLKSSVSVIVPSASLSSQLFSRLSSPYQSCWMVGYASSDFVSCPFFARVRANETLWMARNSFENRVTSDMVASIFERFQKGGFFSWF